MSCGVERRCILQVCAEMQACSKSVTELFEQGQDFDRDLLGITVLHSLLQVAHRLKGNGLSETLEDMRSMLSSTSAAPEHTHPGFRCIYWCNRPGSLQQQTFLPLAFNPPEALGVLQAWEE